MCYHQAQGTCYVASKPMASDQAGQRCMQVYKKYPEAKAECDNLGMTLAVITSAAENEVVRKICGEQACWIGLHERPNTEDWVWENAVSLVGAYSNWYPGQPNNWRSADAAPHIEEDAAAMNCWKGFDGRWCDVNGTQAAIGFVCQSAGTCSGAVTGAVTGSYPHDACQLVTESMLPNIDYNFTGGSTCESTPTIFDGGSFCWKEGASSCYIAARQAWDGDCLKGGKIYQQGRSVCRVFGGDLVKIESAAEQTVVQEACGDQMCWIGLGEGIDTESWTWFDGTSVSGYENWAPGQPDNGVTHGYDDSHWNKAAVPGYDETAAVMNLIPDMDGKWRDTYETARFGFVCEVPSQICFEAELGQSFAFETRLDVKAVLMQMAQCTPASPMKSESINAFSFETNCGAPATAPTTAPTTPAPQLAGAAGMNLNDDDDDDDSMVLIIVIIALGAFVVILGIVVCVLCVKYRKASDPANTNLPKTNYGNSA